jgi:acyl carrier protein
MVIDDVPLAVLTRERMRSVLEPKAHGAWLLHEATRDLKLDCFVMFSSVSSLFGNPAQGNYSAANAFLDALTHYRRAIGLPALTINWGVLGGQGYVARNERVAEFLARQGTAALSPREVISILDSTLKSGDAQLASIRVDWAKWRQFFRAMQENPFLEPIFASLEGAAAGPETNDWRAKIESASAQERPAVIARAVRAIVGGVLRVKPETLRDEQPLTDLGLDSLMGVEIEASLEAAVGVALPPTSLMRARTIGQIAVVICDHLGGGAASAPAPAAAPAEAAQASEVDLDALSDEDIDRLLGDGPTSGGQPESEPEIAS